MNITTTILTVGTALRHAQQSGATVEILLGGAWMSGQVTAVDGEGVCMVTPDGGATVIRISAITAVRIDALAEPEAPPERTPYDGFRFPKPKASDLGPMTPPAPAPAPEVTVVTPYPVPVASRR
jgi:hypothetical protein